MDAMIPTILLALLVIIFSLGTSDKWRHFVQFEAAVSGYRLLPHVLIKPFAAGFVIAETASALLLLIPASRGLGVVLAVIVLGLANVGVAVNLARGRRNVDCGCGGLGHGSGGLSAWLVVRNGVLLAAAALLWFAPSGVARPIVWLDGITFAGATLSLLGLYYAANVLMDNRMHKEAA